MATNNPVLISRPRTGKKPLLLGEPDYAYEIVAERFASLLEEHDFVVTTIDVPEQFKNQAFADTHGLGQGEHLHLIFRNTEDIRPIPSAYNVACFSWNFDALKNSGPADELILKDQVRMLRACDEIWVPSLHAQAVLAAHGIDRAFVIPAPIPQPAAVPVDRHDALGSLAMVESTPLVTHTSAGERSFHQLAEKYARRLGSQPRLKRALAGGRIILTVCDATNPRKNLAAMIEGFLMAAADRDDVVLLVKLVNSGSMESPSAYLFHQIRGLFGHPHCLHEDRVLFFAGALSDAELGQLYTTADFYLSASLGEAQNLPLLEAMAHGAVPVSVRNSGMADYIDEEDAVVIDERRFAGLAPALTPELAQMRLETSFADRYQIAEAIGRALALDEIAREAKSRAARDRAAARYAPDKVYDAIVARLKVVRPALMPTREPVPSMSAERPAGKRWWR